MTVDAELLDKKALKELLIKNWMTHDAMWFAQCLQEFGIDEANKMNKAALRAMAAVEVKRVQKAIDLDSVKTFEDLRVLVDALFTIIKGDFMDFTYGWSSENVLRGEWRSCFAYEGMKKLGVADKYQCGIAERTQGWFDSLGLKYQIRPRIDICMMHTQGKCARETTFILEE